MKTLSTLVSVADYCQDMVDGKIVVNHEYQREAGIWSSFVRSYFIESILLEYPIPKIFLYTRYNLKTRQATKEIVDGQQRSDALRSFFENKMKLSTRLHNPEFSGKKYSQIDDAYKNAFLSYNMSVDEFSGIPEEEIWESFTRMNTNNISLNSEEVRNAKYQGVFKWFISDITKKFRRSLLDADVFSRRDVVRMQDSRVFVDLVSLIIDGFITVRPPQLDRLYREYNLEFPRQDEIDTLVSEGVQTWLGFDELFGSKLSRKHIFYTHIAAIIDLRTGLLSAGLDDQQRAVLDHAAAIDLDFGTLAAAIDNPGAYPQLTDFVDACVSGGTNVGEQKLIRFSYLRSATKDYI